MIRFSPWSLLKIALIVLALSGFASAVSAAFLPPLPAGEGGRGGEVLTGDAERVTLTTSDADGYAHTDGDHGPLRHAHRHKEPCSAIANASHSEPVPAADL